MSKDEKIVRAFELKGPGEEDPLETAKRIADMIVEILTVTAESADLDVCPVGTVVAGRIMETMMDSGHEGCAYALALSAATEAMKRMNTENKDVGAVLAERLNLKPTEH